MSTLRATIKEIQSVDNLNLVTFDFNGIDLKMMSMCFSGFLMSALEETTL